MKLRILWLGTAILLGFFISVADAQLFTTLRNFTASAPSYDNPINSDGAYPYYGSLILSGDTLYGTTYYGGTAGDGTVFALNTNGTSFTVLHAFSDGNIYRGDGDNNDGAYPSSGLILSGETLYGTTSQGGMAAYSSAVSGTVFAIRSDGTGYSQLHTFTSTDGYYPDGASPSEMILAGSTLYGAAGGGQSGTIFSVNTNGGGFRVLYSFTTIARETNANAGETNLDGAGPGGLIMSGDTLYGAAGGGGGLGNGTIFAISTNGTGFTVIHTFSLAPSPNYTNGDGQGPNGGLILSGDILYGTTAGGGTGASGTVFAVRTDGAGFTVLHNFTKTPPANDINVDGDYPNGGLILSGATLYGTAQLGGSSADGTVFAINTNGTGFTVLHNFTTLSGSYGVYGNGSNGDGAYPTAGLILSDRLLYGTASMGGSSGNGTVFSLTLPGFPDLVATSLTWDTNGGLDFSYTLQAGALTNTTDAVLYWANGTNLTNIISTIYDEPILADFEVGTTNTAYAAATFLASPPTNASYILLVVNPNNSVTEASTNNNTLAIPYVQLLPTFLQWNVQAGGDFGFPVDFTYTESGGPLPVATFAELFWANGTNLSNILSSTPLYTEIVGRGEQGPSSTNYVPASLLANPPSGTSNLLLVLDPDHLDTLSYITNIMSLQWLPLGIDVSEDQGTLNWPAVKMSGISFAFVRATLGVANGHYVDSQLITNVIGFLSIGVPVGVYHEAFPQNNANPTNEADNFLTQAGKFIGNGFLPPVLIVETSANPAGTLSLSDWISDWLQYVEQQSKVSPILYANKSTMEALEKMDDNLVSSYSNWVASYDNNPASIPKAVDGTLFPDWQFKQYSTNGVRQGVPGNTNGEVDLDSFAGNLIVLSNLTVHANAPTSLVFFTGTGGTVIQPPQNGQFQFQVAAPGQQQVVVQASQDLLNWTDVATLPTVNGIAVFTDSNAGKKTYNFYRVKP